MKVLGDVATTGRTGTSLIKGVQLTLSAMALSVKDGGTVESIEVGGSVSTEGADLVSYEVEQGSRVGALRVAKGMRAAGTGSRATRIEGENPELSDIEVFEG